MRKVLMVCVIFALLAGCSKKKTLYINTIPDELEQIEELKEIIEPITEKVEPKKKEKVETVDVSRTVFFAFDCSKLDGEAKRALDVIVDILLVNPKMKLILKGACCPIGEFWYNKGLVRIPKNQNSRGENYI